MHSGSSSEARVEVAAVVGKVVAAAAVTEVVVAATQPGDSTAASVEVVVAAIVEVAIEVVAASPPIQGYKEVYLPVTLKSTFEFVLVTFHSHANNT